MQETLKVYNSLSKQKELFSPTNPHYVGMYVCGPTVYNDVHLGNVRTFISFDVIYRYLLSKGYTVRYVRNITDVGHLTGDGDTGEDKIGQKAKTMNIEPMEVVQKYTNGFHKVMNTFNTLPPSIEPTATGHIIEQIEAVKSLIKNGWAYTSHDSVYFDVPHYNKQHHYGKLSGRNIEELLSNTRELEGQEEKKNPLDFALWKKANTNHLMKWNSPWGMGFPGWHLECSVMSTQYLGNNFDIHGGGMDLRFPHHECEIAQCVGLHNHTPAKYWIHTNMLTVNGQKMSKSLGNSFLPDDLITGNHPLLQRGYSPMTIRFFMLQTHYASTLDFSNDALNSSAKAFVKILNALKILKTYHFSFSQNNTPNEKIKEEIIQLCQNCSKAMDDDFNTALTIGHLFHLVKKINSLATAQIKPDDIGEETFLILKNTFLNFTKDILGLEEENTLNNTSLLQTIIQIYSEAKANKDYQKVDALRKLLKKEKIILKDMKNTIDWEWEE